MRAMLLAAGLGERMRPLTGLVPKAVIPVLGRPLAAAILERLAKTGVERAVVNLHHLPDAIRAVLGDGRDLGLAGLDYSPEPAILGTAGGIGKAAALLRGDGPFVVHNADCLSDVDLGALLRFHRTSGCPATLTLAPWREGYTPIAIDARARVISIGGPPGAEPGRFLFTGIAVLSETILDRLSGDRPADIVKEIYLDLARRRELAAFVHEGFWWEFGSPSSYLDGSLRLMLLPAARLESVTRTDPVRRQGHVRVAIGAGADFHTGVELRGGVALGFGCRVGEGSELEDTVVMPEAWIGPGSRLRRVVVGPGAELPGGFEAESTLVCPDADPAAALPAGTSRRSGLRLTRLAEGDGRHR
jgi:NDP-sugar pyrophosphorylase family protein